jgi:hypothetical protein
MKEKMLSSKYITINSEDSSRNCDETFDLEADVGS